MDIITRPIEPGEAEEVQKLGRRSFHGLEGLGISKPKQAIAAVKDDKIVGAVQFKFYSAGGKKVGYFDYAFIDPDYHNQGIGTILYKTATDYLWEQGCDAQTALVKDDNVGSWGLFVKNGFARVSLPELARQFGLWGMLRLYFGTVMNIANGMDYYATLRGRQCPSGKGGNAAQIAAYLLVNFLLALFVLFEGRKNPGAFFAAYGIFLVGGVLAGYAGTLFSKRKWSFRLCIGGALVSAIINLIGGIFPMIGNWYPDVYEKSGRFRRDLGVQALTGWIFVLGLTLVSMMFSGRSLLVQYLSQIGSVFLIYRVLALYPFESFGGGRVYRWSKCAYLFLSALSAAVYLLNFVL